MKRERGRPGVLGDCVTVLEDAAGFAKVRRPQAGRLDPERAPPRRRGHAGAWAQDRARDVDLRTRLRVHRSQAEGAPDGARGAKMGFSDFLEGKGTAGGAYSWLRVALPDGREGYVSARDVEWGNADSPPSRKSSSSSPSSWIAFGKRFLGAPYTWGGTTPLGFDCSGLIARIFLEHGVALRRNSYEQAFQDPQLVPVASEKLKPGDLLFFGTEDKIDHEAMWIGDGTVLQATPRRAGVQITPYDEPRSEALFRYARRLRKERREDFFEEVKGPRLTQRRCATCSARPRSPTGASARFGIWFKDLSAVFHFQESLSLDACRLHDEDARSPRAPCGWTRGP